MKTPAHALVEPLESRIAPAALAFPQFANDISAKLSVIQASVDAAVLVTSAIPVVGGEITKAAKLFDAFSAQLHTALTALGNGPSDAQVQSAIFNVLFPLNLLADNNGDVLINSGDVVISHTAPAKLNEHGSYISFDLHLHRDAVLVSGEQSFNIGLKSLPIEVLGTGGVDVTFGFDYSHLKFGFGENTGTYFDAAAVDELSLTVQASLHANSSLTATLGFLKATITDGSSTDASKHTNLNAGFVVDVSATGGVANFSFTGGADVYLQVDASITADFPGIGADLELHWMGPTGKSASAPTVQFKHVRVNLGGAISSFVSPILDVVDSVIKPVQPIIDFVTAPIPVLSDLSHVVGGGDITLLGIADAAKSEIPAGYEDLFVLASTAAKVVKFSENFKTSQFGQVSILVGDFFASNEDPTKPDLRDAAAASGAGSAATTSNLSTLVASGVSPDFNINDGIDKALDAVGLDKNNQIVQDLKDTLDEFIHPNGISYSIPFLTDPASAVFGLLLGRDATLFTLDAKLKLGGEFSKTYPLPLGFDVGFAGQIKADLQLHLGYDTFGLREFIADTANLANGVGNVNVGKLALDVLDGIYMSTSTHAYLDAGIAATAGIDIVIASVDVKGGVQIGLHIDSPADVNNTDNDPSKIHFRSELKDCLFDVTGGISAFLDVVAKIGIGPFSISKTFNLAHVKLLDFGSCIPNPFLPPPDLQLASTHADDATVPNDGTLRLNVGAFANQRGVSENVIAENYQLYAGNKPGDIVVVAFGYAQNFSGIHHIVADAGAGNDTILLQSLDKDVPLTADVRIDAGDDDDQITYQGTGEAHLFGGAGNDTLIGGNGVNYLNGGEGNDQLTGGKSANHLGVFTLAGVTTSENGNDVLIGGTGANTLDGGDGDDALFAGKTNGDVLTGGKGNDQLTAGTGTASFYGGAGDDRIFWKAGDGKPTVLDGGSDLRENNALEITGSPADDSVTLSKNGPDSRVVVTLDLPGQTFPFLAKSIHNIFIEGGAGADHLTVNSLTGTPVHDVGLNLSDVLKDKLKLGDGAIDILNVNGSALADTTQIRAEQVAIQFDPNDRPALLGGVMKLSGLSTYTVRLANVQDDFTYNAGSGNDQTTVFSNTGPTKILGGAGDDGFTIVAKNPGNPANPADPLNPKDYVAGVSVDAGAGKNTIFIQESQATVGDTIDLSSTQFHSKLLPNLNFIATGGSYKNVLLSAPEYENQIFIVSLPAGANTLVFSGVSNDLIKLGTTSTGAGGSLDSILGVLKIEAGGGVNQLQLVDFGDANGNAKVTVSATQVLGLAGAADNTPIDYSATNGTLLLTIEGSNSPADENFTLNAPGAKVILNGNDGNEHVTIQALTLPATIHGGAGDDSVTIGSAAHLVAGVISPVTFTGDAGTDTLVIDDKAAASAQSYGVNAKTITYGGIGITNFDSSLESVQLFAGKGYDTVNLNALAATQVTLDGGLGGNRINGPSTTNTWNITTTDSGTLNSNVRFAKFANLVGGAGNDRFVLANGKGVSGDINAGAGNDTLDYSAATGAVNVNLSLSTATNIVGGITGFENVTGGNGDDILVGDGAANTLVGGAGRDVIIGRNGADNIGGGTGEDLLIGGSTNFDAVPSALAAIAKEWSSGHAYLARVVTLGTGVGPNNATRLTSLTVHDDGLSDALSGGIPELDWFFASVTPGPGFDKIDFMQDQEKNG